MALTFDSSVSSGRKTKFIEFDDYDLLLCLPDSTSSPSSIMTLLRVSLLLSLSFDMVKLDVLASEPLKAEPP